MLRRASSGFIGHVGRAGLTARPVVMRSIKLRSLSTTQTRFNDAKNTMSDAEVDQWLKAVAELKEEFAQSEYLPEKSLAPPGQTRIDLIHEITSEHSRNGIKTATPDQRKEWEALQAVPFVKRKDDVVEHVTNMIMKDGKKEKAQKILSRAFYLVFCRTRLDPIDVLKKALDDLAPLMVVKTFNTGVAKSAMIPVPLNKRQRNRIAWKWIIDGANKRVSQDFAVRLGEELLSVHLGNSANYDKRDQMHKSAIAHRAYIKLK